MRSTVSFGIEILDIEIDGISDNLDSVIQVEPDEIKIIIV